METLGKILLIEDSPEDVELTLSALEEQNIANEVVVARDGAEGLDYLYRRGTYELRDTSNPMVILLDLKLPKVDGLEVLATVKADPNLGQIPVVILTSSREEQDLVEGYSLGANAYVVKPVSFNDFVEVVKEVGLFWVVVNEPPPGSIDPPG